jgi:hypothetical protein
MSHILTPPSQPESFDAETVVRRLSDRGTNPPLLIKCTDGINRVVKLPTEKYCCQGLVNEWVAGCLLRRFDLPTPSVSSVSIGPSFQPGPFREQFLEARGVLEPLAALGMTYLPEHNEVAIPLEMINNPDTAYGAVVFDTWVFNEDARQFLGRENDGNWNLTLFDNDGAFNRSDWSIGNKNAVRADTKCKLLSDQLKSLVKRGRLDAFEKWFAVLEDKSRWENFAPAIKRDIPIRWLERLLPSPPRGRNIDQLLDDLAERRHLVRGMFVKEAVARATV